MKQLKTSTKTYEATEDGIVRIHNGGAEYAINNNNKNALLFVYAIKRTINSFYDPRQRKYVNKHDVKHRITTTEVARLQIQWFLNLSTYQD